MCRLSVYDVRINRLSSDIRSVSHFHYMGPVHGLLYGQCGGCGRRVVYTNPNLAFTQVIYTSVESMHWQKLTSFYSDSANLIVRTRHLINIVQYAQDIISMSHRHSAQSVRNVNADCTVLWQCVAGAWFISTSKESSTTTAIPWMVQNYAYVIYVLRRYMDWHDHRAPVIQFVFTKYVLLLYTTVKQNNCIISIWYQNSLQTSCKLWIRISWITTK